MYVEVDELFDLVNVVDFCVEYDDVVVEICG